MLCNASPHLHCAWQQCISGPNENKQVYKNWLETWSGWGRRDVCWRIGISALSGVCVSVCVYLLGKEVFCMHSSTFLSHTNNVLSASGPRGRAQKGTEEGVLRMSPCLPAGMSYHWDCVWVNQITLSIFSSKGRAAEHWECTDRRTPDKNASGH